jgi:hypothetical protein
MNIYDNINKPFLLDFIYGAKKKALYGYHAWPSI